MKLTKQQLKQLIKEELQKILQEQENKDPLQVALEENGVWTCLTGTPSTAHLADVDLIKVNPKKWMAMMSPDMPWD
jgi:hypothetical protein